MAGIIDYIRWRGDLSFKDVPINPVDSLIFSKIAYMDFYHVLGESGQAYLCDLYTEYFEKDDNKELGALLTGDFYLLLQRMAESKRFARLLLKNCVDIVSQEEEIQFSAITIEFGEQEAYIAYRGTDDTIVGWKEDFNMSFMKVVPAQKKALDYLNHVVINSRYRDVYIGGHSKGGNLAVYAGVNSLIEVKKVIRKVYNLDGPGFHQGALNQEFYQDMLEKIVTLIPQSSVVGMLLEHEENYVVVKSNQRGAMQHDGFSWQVMGDDFEYLSEIEDDSKIVDLTIKRVLERMPLEKRQEVTNVLFEVLTVDDSRTLTDLSKDRLKTLIGMSKNYSHLNKETKKAVRLVMSAFVDEGYKSFRQIKNVDQWNKRLKEWQLRTLHKVFKSKS